MTMRDDVEIVKESAEKSMLIEKLKTDLSIADMLLGSLFRAAWDAGLDIVITQPVDEEM